MKAIIDALEFQRLMKGTKKHVTKNQWNNMMLYIHFIINKEKNEVTAESLDGHRFAVFKAKIKECDKSFEFFINPEIPKISKYDRFVEIELKKDYAYVTVGDTTKRFLQPNKDAKFYDLSTYISNISKKEVKSNVCVNAKLLAESLLSINNIDLSGKNIVKLEIREERDPIIIKDKNNTVIGVLPISTSSF